MTSYAFNPTSKTTIKIQRTRAKRGSTGWIRIGCTIPRRDYDMLREKYAEFLEQSTLDRRVGFETFLYFQLWDMCRE